MVDPEQKPKYVGIKKTRERKKPEKNEEKTKQELKYLHDIDGDIFSSENEKDFYLG